MKFIGIALIIAATVICSYTYENQCKKRLICLKDIYDYVYYVKLKIRHLNLTVEEIFEKYEKKEIIKLYLTESFDKLKDTGEKELINDFFSSLGQGYKQEQLELCDYTLDGISKKISDLEKSSPTQIKIFRTFSLFICASIIIFLI